MADAGFIFALVVGATILMGMLVVAHISSAWLKAHREEQASSAAAAAAFDEPPLPMSPFVEVLVDNAKAPRFYGGNVVWSRKRPEKAS